MEDAVATLINYVLCHREEAKTHARVLYLDMSSPFNTLQPHLFKKLISEFKLESELALWVLDFFVGRPQHVRVNNTTSSVKVVSLSYLLFYLYYIQMTAGASVRIGILLNSFVARCDRSCLCLNATKTKDICIDFRKYPQSQSDTVINDNNAEVVDEYKYLGTTIDNRLKWDRHSTVT